MIIFLSKSWFKQNKIHKFAIKINIKTPNYQLTI